MNLKRRSYETRETKEAVSDFVNNSKVLLKWDHFLGKDVNKSGAFLNELDQKSILKIFNIIELFNLKKITELQQEEHISLYTGKDEKRYENNGFPKKSIFKEPDELIKNNISGDKNLVQWGTLRFDGQKARIAGVLFKKVFYPIFLDKEHKFAPCKNRE